MISSCSLADGATLAVHVQGKGPDLLLVSGLGGTAAFWEPAARGLADSFRVICFDQRGIGASTRGTARVTIDQLAEDGLAVLVHVDSTKALLLGHSTGGCVVQTMALLRESGVAGLILSATWLKPNRYMTALFRSRLAILDAAPREYAAAGLFLGYPADWLEANWTTYEAALAQAPITAAQRVIVAERIDALLQFDRSAEIGRLTVPQLILGAEDDLIVPAFLQRELKAAFAKADAHYFKTGGHFFPVSRTEEFANAVREWAARVG